MVYSGNLNRDTIIRRNVTVREYNAIAMDLDDTLLTSDLQISNETKNALLKCQEDGIIVILASGRPIYAIEKYAKEIGRAHV